MHKLASARSEGNHAGEANKKKSIRFVVSTPRAHIKKRRNKNGKKSNLCLANSEGQHQIKIGSTLDQLV